MPKKVVQLSRAAELEQVIVEAVATLDGGDGSRIGLIEAIDSARSTLTEVYGVDFDRDLALYNGEDWDDDDDDDEFDDDDE